jgi:hypothetical protein
MRRRGEELGSGDFLFFSFGVKLVWAFGWTEPVGSARFSVFHGLTAVAKDEKPSFERMVRSTTHTRILQITSSCKLGR